MRGWSRERRAGVALVVAALVGLAGCYYRKYDSLVRTHVDLMLAMAEKRHDLAGRDLVPNPSEFAYPLERARDFARIVRSSFAERESFRRFEAFTERYAAFLADPGTGGAREAALGKLRTDAKDVTAALDRER